MIGTMMASRSTVRLASGRRRVAALVVGAALLGTACGGGLTAGVPPEEIGHVHDLVPDGDVMLVAAHRGLHRVEAGRLTFVGDEVNDLMSMARLPDGSIIASGHPDLRVERYRVEGAPSFLGLIRSDDNGVSWEIVDLLGEADFHALAPVTDGFFGADGASGSVWRFDAEGDGQPVGSIPFDVKDLAVSPADNSLLVSSSYDGEVAVSDDAAQTWELVDDLPLLTEIEWTAGGVVGADLDGELWTAEGPTGPYVRLRSAPDEVDALLVTASGETWLATHGGRIWRARDGGSWESMSDEA